MFQPTLAVPPKDKYPLQFPFLASPKIDGVRALVDIELFSRTYTPIANLHTQSKFAKPELWGLDGELAVGAVNDPNVYNTTSKVVNSINKVDDVKYYVFDSFKYPDKPFHERLAIAKKTVESVPDVVFVEHTLVNNQAELDAYEKRMLEMGFEGVMLRKPDGEYKYGRSTAKQQILLKIKRFLDSEAEVIGVVPLMKNNNPAEKNAFGRTKRSSKKANKVPQDKMGALVVKDLTTQVEFEIGTGFTDKEREQKWEVGTIVKYKYQPHGVLNKPRSPVYLGIRPMSDIGEVKNA